MGKLIEAIAALFTVLKTKKTDIEVLAKDRLKFIRRKIRRLRRKMWRKEKKSLSPDQQLEELIDQIKLPIDAKKTQEKDELSTEGGATNQG